MVRRPLALSSSSASLDNGKSLRMCTVLYCTVIHNVTSRIRWSCVGVPPYMWWGEGEVWRAPATAGGLPAWAAPWRRRPQGSSGSPFDPD